MKNLITSLICVLMFTYSAKSQDWVDLNVVIIVNEVVNSSAINLKASYYSKNGSSNNIDVKYIPGSLKMKREDYDLLLNESVENIQIEVRYFQLCNEKVNYSYYLIEDFKVQWLKDDFYILRIYDTSLRKYRKLYNSLPNKSFTYEYDSPSGSMRRVQKKHKKSDNCP